MIDNKQFLNLRKIVQFYIVAVTYATQWFCKKILNYFTSIRKKMVYTVEMNDGLYRHSMAATASATKRVNQTSDEYKSRKICCQALGVMIGIIIVAVVTSLFVFYSNHGSKLRKI